MHPPSTPFKTHFKLSEPKYCYTVRRAHSQICPDRDLQLEWWANPHSTWRSEYSFNVLPSFNASYRAGINSREQDGAMGTENIPQNMDFIKPTCFWKRLHKHSSEKDVMQDPWELNIYEVWWGLKHSHLITLLPLTHIPHGSKAPLETDEQSYHHPQTPLPPRFCKCPDPSDWKEFSVRLAKCGHLTWDKWTQMSFSILQAVYVWWVPLSRDKRFVLSCF